MKHGGAGGKPSWPLQFHCKGNAWKARDEALDNGVGGSVKKSLAACKFWNVVGIQPEVLTLFNTPQVQKPHEPIDTLTDLPKWEANWKKSWWLQLAALSCGRQLCSTASSGTLFQPQAP
ncbi:hypothetical protein TGAM01_v205196 [Trichoderma gamsii]|uniref:Uncharacterized protein n=1 Tax=Trichoderma gamsii TaxID=398673 RepID=A0A0W7VVJ3_9HYPO|nr:hypothetical protein TGAM01_v205196 [Trichoderma gamsii]PNP38896.1 hypothetical protein TGAMA5MH_09120 [Trichoderma gamsii]PON25759.1 hypothetical protein TGAM01_v205196 [Trichoderma gamsii]